MREHRPPDPAILGPLGAQLRQLRLERSLSQQRLAARSGVDYKYIGKVERRESDPVASDLGRLARGLEVSFVQLFETLSPSDTLPYHLSPADLESISTALATLTRVIERVRRREPPPVPTRAPRRRRRARR